MKEVAKLKSIQQEIKDARDKIYDAEEQIEDLEQLIERKEAEFGSIAYDVRDKAEKIIKAINKEFRRRKRQDAASVFNIELWYAHPELVFDLDLITKGPNGIVDIDQVYDGGICFTVRICRPRRMDGTVVMSFELLEKSLQDTSWIAEACDKADEDKACKLDRRQRAEYEKLKKIFGDEAKLKKRRARYEKLKAKFEQACEEESNDT